MRGFRARFCARIPRSFLRAENGSSRPCYQCARLPSEFNVLARRLRRARKSAGARIAPCALRRRQQLDSGLRTLRSYRVQTRCATLQTRVAFKLRDVGSTRFASPHWQRRRVNYGAAVAAVLQPPRSLYKRCAPRRRLSRVGALRYSLAGGGCASVLCA